MSCWRWLSAFAYKLTNKSKKELIHEQILCFTYISSWLSCKRPPFYYYYYHYYYYYYLFNKTKKNTLKLNGNRTQMESKKLFGVFCYCTVIRTLSLVQEFMHMCQRMWWRWTAAAWWRCAGIKRRSSGCRRWWLRGGSPALEGFHPFDVDGSKRFESQQNERVRLLQINVLVILPGGGVLCSSASLRRC